MTRETAKATTAAAAQHFRWNGWAVLAEVSAPDDADAQRPGARRVDLLAVRQPHRRVDELGVLERLALEVKVTRADFANDVRHPEKQAPWRALAHRHAYVVPAGLVRKDEVPAGSGLLVVDDSRGRPVLRWEVRAPYTGTPVEVPAWLTRALAYRASEAEARIAGWVLDGDDEQTLRAEVERLRREVARAGARQQLEQAAAQRWQQLYAAAGGLPCATCGAPVRPERVRVWAARWRHARPEDDQACAAQRAPGQPITPREDPPAP